MLQTPSARLRKRLPRGASRRADGCVRLRARSFGDWIQGGFLYALYAEYGYAQSEVALIFVAGYASAMTLGTYVAALGDVAGHRGNCIAYGLLYAASCALLRARLPPGA